jgi:hypothetical protein
MSDHPLLPGYRSRESQRANVSALAAMELRDYERAEMLFRYALELNPQHFGAWLNLGTVAGHRGRHREALRYYHTAHTLAPLDYRPRINTAHAHLMLGEYREGWAVYEERWRGEEFLMRTGLEIGADAILSKRWDGVRREGKRLLVFSEQGVGDVLMMLRYWATLCLTDMDIIYRVPASLYRLVLRNVPPNARVVMSSEPVPEHDYHCPFMSLPYLFRMQSEADIPGAAGYLSTVAREFSGFTVGLVWAGNPDHKGDKDRSMAFAVLAPLFERLPSVRWISLQIGERAADIANTQIEYPEMRDYEDTARVIAGLDCVVTVDTSVAHLAGALGVPVLLMLGSPHDWRWGVNGERTPWYSSVRLFRQSHPGDWGPVVSSVRWELSEMVRERRVA